MRHEGAGNCHVGEMDGDRTVAANMAWRHCPTIRPGILVEPDLHPIEPLSEAAKGTATLIRTGNAARLPRSSAGNSPPSCSSSVHGVVCQTARNRDPGSAS